MSIKKRKKREQKQQQYLIALQIFEGDDQILRQSGQNNAACCLLHSAAPVRVFKIGFVKSYVPTTPHCHRLSLLSLLQYLYSMLIKPLSLYNIKQFGSHFFFEIHTTS